MKDIEKLESGKYLLISKNRLALQNWGLILAILSGLIYGVRKDGLTFDSPSQKQNILSHVTPSNGSIQIHLTTEDRYKLAKFETIQQDVLIELQKLNDKVDKLR